MYLLLGHCLVPVSDQEACRPGGGGGGGEERVLDWQLRRRGRAGTGRNGAGYGDSERKGKPWI